MRRSQRTFWPVNKENRHTWLVVHQERQIACKIRALSCVIHNNLTTPPVNGVTEQYKASGFNINVSYSIEELTKY